MRRSRTLLTKLLFIASWIIGAGLFVAGVGALAMYAAWFPDWVGFGADALPAGSASTPVVIYQQEKTLWDWLQLLLVPLVLTLGGIWLTTSENRAAREAAERQVSENTRIENERRAAQERIEDERRAAQERLEQERGHDAVLQAYLDHMTELLLTHDLRKSVKGSEVRSVARARTLTVLRVLDASRKGTVVQFLSEAKLIQGGQGSTTVPPIISLSGAQLAGTDLQGADLGGVELRGANLAGANLEDAYLELADLVMAHLAGANLGEAHLGGANLWKADLRWAALQGTDLMGANLMGANLSGADLSGARLQEAHLAGADLRGSNAEEAIYGNISKLEYAILDDAQRKVLDLPPKPQPSSSISNDEIPF